MKEFAIFQVLRRTPTPVPYTPQVVDETFLRLAKTAFEGGISRKPPERTGSMIQIKALLPNRALEQVLELLQSEGWNPVFGHVSHDTDGRFPVRVAREYDEDDLNAAEILHVGSVWGEWPITGFVRRNGDRWVGDVDRVGIHSGLKWEQQIGYVDGAYNYFVNDSVREGMLRGGLRGLRFHPLEWNIPSRAQGKFWEVDSTALMPPCNLPVVDMDGTKFYEENGHSPVELQFPADDVHEIGAFDLAWCREEIGDLEKSNWGRHVLVVSKRFRSVMKDLGVGDLITFYPVRLKQ